jgi:hypothetical protein
MGERNTEAPQLSYDPIPASGAGAEHFDLPELFYLSNQTVIDEWHNLCTNVADSVHNWYRTILKAALAGPASERGLQLSEAAGPNRRRHLLLHPSGTPVLNNKPVIGVGLAWPDKSVNPATSPPFVCVRASRNETGKNAAKVLLDNGGRSFRTATPEAKGTDTDTWPIWWWVRAMPNWWTDLDRYRDDIVQNVLALTDAIRIPLEAAAAVKVTGSTDEDD